jgi:hypothetical protein
MVKLALILMNVRIIAQTNAIRFVVIQLDHTNVTAMMDMSLV